MAGSGDGAAGESAADERSIITSSEFAPIHIFDEGTKRAGPGAAAGSLAANAMAAMMSHAAMPFPPVPPRPAMQSQPHSLPQVGVQGRTPQEEQALSQILQQLQASFSAAQRAGRGALARGSDAPRPAKPMPLPMAMPQGSRQMPQGSRQRSQMPQGHPQRSEGDRQQPHPNHMPQLPLMQPLMQHLIYSQAHLQQFPQHQPQQPYTQQHLQPQQQNQPQQQIQHLEPGTDKARVSAARSKDMYITTPLLTKLFGRKSESEDLPGVWRHPSEILAPPVALGGRKADRGRVRRRTEETGGGLLLAKRARDAAAVGGRTIVSGDKSSQKAGLVEVSNPSVLGKPVDLRWCGAAPQPQTRSHKYVPVVASQVRVRRCGLPWLLPEVRDPEGDGAGTGGTSEAKVSSTSLASSATASLAKSAASSLPRSSFSSPLSSSASFPALGENSPRTRLRSILVSHGCPRSPPTAGDAGYATQPSPLQKASHGTALLRAVQRSDTEALVGLLRAGLSPNPCNAHGDSVLQMVAKRSDYSLFRALVVDGGASLRVADSFGRTVLHHAAWADAASDDTFRIVRLVLERCGPEILWLTDKNGIGPFDFLRDEKWDPWAKFLEESQDVLTAIIGREPPTPAGGDVEGMLPDPPGALKPEMAARVASGEVVDAK